MGPKQETPEAAPQQPPQGRPQPPPPKPKVALAQLANDCLQIMDDPAQPEIVHRLAGIGRQVALHVMQLRAAVQKLAELREADLKEIGGHFEQITGLLQQMAGPPVPREGQQGPAPAEGSPQEMPQQEVPPGAAETAPPAAAPAAPQTRAERLAAHLAAKAQQKKDKAAP